LKTNASVRKLFQLSQLPVRNYDSLIAAIAGFLIILAFSRHGGIGVSPDSVIYISVAGNIHDHALINDFTKNALMDFPAFYPIFLSGIMFLTGMDVVHFGPVLNGVMFGLVIYLSGWMMERFSFRSKWYKWILLSLIVFSPCLLEVYSMLWSETLFLLLLLLFIICTRRYFGSHRVAALMLMAFIAGLACVTRYAGITLIGTGGLLILFDGNLSGGKKIRHLFLFGFTAFFLPFLNLYRNKHVTGTLTGYREKGIVPFYQNLHDFGNVFGDWLPFPNIGYRVAVLTGLFWIIFFIIVFIRRLIRKQRFFSYENIAITYFLVYTVFILLTATISRFQTLDSRLLSPLFLPWLWGASCWVPTWIATWTAQRRRIVLAAAVVAAISFQIGQLLDDYETWDGVKYAGIPGYTEDDWRHSQTMNYVRENRAILQKPGGTLYSNAFEGIWFLTGMKADMIPHKDFSRDIKEFLAEKHFYIVWFNDGLNPDLVSIDYISRYKKLASEKIFNDGAVYYFVTDSTMSRP
jgi:hypothetical protein